MQKKKSGVKKWVANSAIKGGGGPRLNGKRKRRIYHFVLSLIYYVMHSTLCVLYASVLRKCLKPESYRWWLVRKDQIKEFCFCFYFVFVLFLGRVKRIVFLLLCFFHTSTLLLFANSVLQRVG